MRAYESELEYEEELEAELESEYEEELEGEQEEELESEYEGEEFLGTMGRVVGGLLGPGEGEFEEEYEGEFEEEYEGEFEGEEFLGRAFRGIGRFVRRAAPVLRSVARVAAPVVGGMVGGPVGATLGRAASQLLEGEYEEEYEAEFEEEGEFEEEYEAEAEAARPVTGQQALAEFMATGAAQAESEAEAEAMIGAATVATISPADRAALLGIIPHLNRGSAILTRILRRRAVTRPVVRTVPTIVQRTARVLAQRQRAGRPVTRRTAARVMANQTRRVLGSPRTCASALRRNVRATAVVRRPAAGRPAPVLARPITAGLAPRPRAGGMARAGALGPPRPPVRRVPVRR
jgi:hypothetical protein